MKEHIVRHKKEYIFLENIPSDNIENKEKDLEAIIQGFVSMHRTGKERRLIKFRELKVEFDDAYKFSYEILLTNKNIRFFYRIPNDFQISLLAKMKAAWPTSRIIETEDPINDINLKASSYKRLLLKDHSFKSLLTDFRSNEPLPSIFNIVKELLPSEKILIQFLFKTTGDEWNNEARQLYSDYINGKLKNVSKGSDKVLAVMDYIANDMFNISNSLLGNKEEDLVSSKNVRMKSDLTNKEKINLRGFKGDIKIIAQSREEKRRDMLIRSVAAGFKILNKDNQLVEENKLRTVIPLKVIKNKKSKKSIFKKVKEENENIETEVKVKDTQNFKDIKNRKMDTESIYSSKELIQFMQMPVKELQDKYNIKRIESFEEDIPEVYLNGNIRIAKMFKDKKTRYITLPTPHRMACKPFIMLGPSGSGKTTTAQNVLLDICNQTDHGLCVFDYIKDCDLSKYIINRMIDDKNNIIIDMTDVNQLPNISLCELDCGPNIPMETRYKNADDIYKVYVSLIEQMKAESTEDMTQRMLKYLRAACLVTFVHPNKSIYDVYKVLESYDERQKAIIEAQKTITHGRFDNNSITIENLRELDKKDSKTHKWETDTSRISGILDRLSMFFNSYHVEIMIKSKRHINFIDIMNEGKRVFFLMPDYEFIEKSEVDVIVNCMLAKMWVAWKKRGKVKEPRIFHVFCDEAHQIPSVCEALSKFMVEVRKYGGAFKFTCHDLDQLKILKKAVAATGANYLVTNGTEEGIIKAIKKELLPFVPDDFTNKEIMPKFTAVVSLKEDNEGTALKVKMLPEHNYGVKKII